uniref:UNC93like proteinlike [Bombus terrestris] n=1 Tax=Lepeophtheirus salmonis TaxID=72036 RepID=A0A0K2UNC0_LEPSM
MLCYSLYIGAQFYPKFYTLIPAAIVLGMGAAPMWSAKCTYLTQVGNKYAEVTGKSVEKVVVRFFGIFFFFFQCSSILGHLISSLVLKRQKSNYTITEDDLSYCGINYCSARNTTDNFSVSDESRWMLSGIFLGCSLLSVVIASIFIDPLTKYGENERNEMGKKLTGFKLFIATSLQTIKTKQLLIIPLTFWSGVEQGFFGADFTAAYVTCVLGINNVGYVLICYGVCDAVFSYFLGSLIKYVGRIPIFYFGAIINAAVILTFFYWTPRPDEIYVFYILSGLWGTADAVWQTQINAFYGVVFEGSEEAAFSNYRLWESLGFIVSYVLEHTVCVYTKVWVLVGVLSAGMIGYTVIEVMLKTKKKSISH